MSQQVFDNYVENAFDGESGQALFKIKEFEENYFQYFPRNKDSFVLDIGIGRGEMLTCFSKQGYRNYLGIDISPSTVKHCQGLNLNCELVKDSLEYLNTNKNKYELITLLDVLEHFELDFGISFLKSLYAALAPGGKIIVQVPNMQAPDGHLHFYNDITHKFGFVEHSLKQLFVTAGLSNFKIFPYETITNNSLKSLIKKALRFLFRKWVRFTRVLTGNLNPEILTPVFFAIIEKRK